MRRPSAAERMTGWGVTRRRCREVGGDGSRSEVAGVAVGDFDGGSRGILGVGAKHGDRAFGGFRRGTIRCRAGSERREIFARDGDAPEVTAVDVVLIGGEEDGAAVRRERRVFDFEIRRAR